MRFGAFAALAMVSAVTQSGCVMSAIMPGVIEAPQIQARAVQFSGTSGGATMRVELVGYNPNSFALYAASLRADLVVSGRSVGTVDASFSQVLPARRPLVVLVEVNVTRSTAVRVGPVATPMNAGPSAPSIAGAPILMGDAMTVEAAPFRVDGTLVFRSRFGDVNVPWGFQGAVQSNVFAGW